MIKTLSLAAALLVPGLAYAGNPSANLPVQIVPASGGGIACDQGPNYNRSVPAPAAAAGFTRCALNADFTTPSYSNLNTFLSNCGAPVGSGWSSPGWVQYWWGIISPQPACGHDISVGTDSGQQVLHLQYLTTDQATGCAAAGRDPAMDHSNCAVFMQWEWPHGFDGSTGLPIETYTEITVRTTAGSLNQYNGAVESFDFWKNSSGAAGVPFQETDFLEVQDACGNCGGTQNVSWPSGYGGNSSSQEVYGDPKAYATWTQYNTFGFLKTYDGSSTIAECYMINGNWQGCGTTTVSDPRTLQYHDGIMELDVGGATGNAGIGGPTNGCGISIQISNKGYPGLPSCILNNEDFYIQAIRVWECDAYQTQECRSALIEHP
jgi:hypothetical protein